MFRLIRIYFVIFTKFRVFFFFVAIRQKNSRCDMEIKTDTLIRKIISFDGEQKRNGAIFHRKTVFFFLVNCCFFFDFNYPLLPCPSTFIFDQTLLCTMSFSEKFSIDKFISIISTRSAKCAVFFFFLYSKILKTINN